MNQQGLDSLHQRLRRARLDAGLTQSALAVQVGCKQSAVSMMEAGRREALSHETLLKVASLLHVEVPDVASEAAAAPVMMGNTRSVCGNFNCPSNLPYCVGETVFFLPLGTAGGSRHCVFCGELLMRTCPDCGSPIVHAGGCCGACGHGLVEFPAAYTDDRSRWIAERVAAIDLLRNHQGA